MNSTETSTENSTEKSTENAELDSVRNTVVNTVVNIIEIEYYLDRLSRQRQDVLSDYHFIQAQSGFADVPVQQWEYGVSARFGV